MMIPSRFLLALAAGVMTLGPIAVHASGPVAPVWQEGRGLESIVRDRKDLSMFRALTETFGVVEPLKLSGLDNKGYTIFVPSDRAFAKLPPQVIEELRRNRDLMQQVLKYHMIAGTVSAAEVTSSMDPATLQGEMVNVRKNGSRVMVGRAMVIEADQRGSNGVIHIIDQVLLPPSIRDDLTRRAILPLNDARAADLGHRANAGRQPRTNVVRNGTTTSGRAARIASPRVASDLIELATSTRDLTTFQRLVTEAGIANWLMDGTYTIFAPTNDAFSNLPKMAMEALVEDKELLKEVLLFHVVRGEIKAKELRLGGIKSAGEGSLYVKVGRLGAAKVNDAIVLDTDLMAQNGAIHTINKVLLPPAVIAKLKAKGISVSE